MTAESREARKRRHRRIRAKISGTAERPRLNVYRSLSNIYAQVIDDQVGHTLVAASTVESDLSSELEGKTKKEQAAVIGRVVAERALEAGISQVVFDRGGYPYHGRVKAVAEAARESGLKF
ncbi:MAG TPA: 50S ribosomal protein L18 [Candidatus Sulfomarinibacteraceae bacterium]|nr:50S ribosomal protein L18 [Candidatus Sulfomarinibacteraceae bacterium]